jgi:hypothetical protein
MNTHAFKNSNRNRRFALRTPVRARLECVFGLDIGFMD